MSYPNSALSAGQIAIMVTVVVACMAIWLIAVFVAARDPWRGHHAEITPIQPPAEETEHKAAA